MKKGIVTREEVVETRNQVYNQKLYKDILKEIQNRREELQSIGKFEEEFAKMLEGQDYDKELINKYSEYLKKE